MVHIVRPDAGVQRLVDLTGASGHPVFQWTEEPMALFRGGFYLTPWLAQAHSLDYLH